MVGTIQTDAEFFFKTGTEGQFLALDADKKAVPVPAPAGSGAVDSVNGNVGAVVLTADDVATGPVQALGSLSGSLTVNLDVGKVFTVSATAPITIEKPTTTDPAASQYALIHIAATVDAVTIDFGIGVSGAGIVLDTGESATFLLQTFDAGASWDAGGGAVSAEQVAIVGVWGSAVRVSVSGHLESAEAPPVLLDINAVPQNGEIAIFTDIDTLTSRTVASASTTLPLGASSIELGHATDTTITRSAAGVVAVEGKAVVLDDNAALTNARTPTAHASSHGAGQADAITIAQSQVTPTAVTRLNANGNLAANAINEFHGSTAAQTVTLPTMANGSILIVDNTSSVSVTVGRNSQTINGASADDTLTTGKSVTYYCTSTGVVRRIGALT
jgi:hypothetical protein